MGVNFECVNFAFVTGVDQLEQPVVYSGRIKLLMDL